MNFKSIYENVELYKSMSLKELLKEFHIKIVYDDSLCYGRDSRTVSVDGITLVFAKEGLPEEKERFLVLHEIGHLVCGCSWLRNNSANELDANTFACLYLLHNDIWESQYFRVFLKENGVPAEIANRVQERIYQFKMTERHGDDWLLMEC